MPHFIAPDGISLYYEDAGTGLPLLCLSGLTRNARDYDYVAPHLSGVRMIRMDYRGRGHSDWADPATYDVKVEMADALALLDLLGIEKAAVLGASRGGLIGMLMAVKAKDRMLGLALNDIGAELNSAGLEVIRGYVGKHPEQKTVEEAAKARMALNAEKFPGVPLERWRKEVTNTAVLTDEGLRLNYDPRLADALGNGEAAAVTLDLWPLFEKVAPLPCAVIHGENSDLLSRETVDEMARRNPDLITAHVPDRAHIPFLDEAESLAALNLWLGQMQ
ncbi:alpha/beta hydrolase [Pseudooceanicola sp.]|uniref:alpha/beta fold hydrolase n=1 Tax=Pseudooceanicola sp. TaxID=1914328 RepID=UPI002613395D|nr:alpha/beta hydrolase [Pseudooceanicola sp.]MDF1855960.1 alpha/beta hydrolase [Pseudooceanicola sp.]